MTPQLASTLFSLSLCLAVSSAKAEVREALKKGDTIPTCAEADPDSGHRYRPGCKETIQRAGFQSEMKYNAHGLRDKDYPPRPAKGWTRVLFVGSSRLAGPGLAESATPPRRFEHYLRKVSRKIEVINAGVEGYMPLNQAARFSAWVAAYAPTHVILQVELPSALANDMMSAPYAIWRKDGLRLERRIFSWAKPFAFLFGLDESKFPELRKIYTWQSTLSRLVRTHWCRLRHQGNLPFISCLMQPTIKAIELMYKQAADAGVRFQLLVTPGNFTSDLLLSPAYDPGVASFVDSFTPRVKVASNDFRKLLEKRAIPTAYGPGVPPAGNTLPGDYHFNVQGADIYGRGLSVKLKEFLELE